MAEDDYVSYLLRLRKSIRAGRPCWQASLEDTRTGQRVNLRFEELMDWLQTRFGSPETEWEIRQGGDGS